MTGKLFFLIFIFIQSILIADTKKPSEFLKHKQKAENFYKKKNWTAFKQELDELLKLAKTKEEKIDANILAGGYYELEKDNKKAITYYETALKEDENQLSLIESLANLYITDTDLETKTGKALPLFLKAESLYSKKNDIFYNIACIYSLQNDTDKSIKYIDKLIYSGFDSIADIQKDPDLENLRKTEYFKKLSKNWKNIKSGKEEILAGDESYRKKNFTKTIEHYKKSKNFFTDSLGENSLYTAQSNFKMGRTYQEQKEFEKAIEFYISSLSIRLNAHIEGHPETTAAYSILGNTQRQRGKEGDYDSSIEYHKKALDLRLKYHPDNSADIASAYKDLGTSYHSKKEYEKAVENYGNALEILLKLDKNLPIAATIYSSIGSLYYDKGEFEKAIKNYQNSLSIQLNLTGDNDLSVADTYNSLGMAYQSKGDYKKALENHEKALNIRLNIYTEPNIQVADSYNNIGVVFNSNGQFDEAIKFYEKALEVQLKLPEDNSLLLARATSYNNIGVSFDSKGDYQKSIEYYKNSLDLRLKVSANHPDAAVSYNNLGEAYNSRGEFEKAIEYHEKSRSILEKTLPENHPHIATSYSNIGSVYKSMGEYDKAIEFHKKAASIFIINLTEEHPDVATVYNSIGLAYQAKGDYKNAMEYFTSSLRIRQNKLREGHPDIAESYTNIGLLLQLKGEHDDAVKFLEKSLSIKISSFGENHPFTAAAYNHLGSVYKSKKDFTRAIENYEKAVKTLENGSDKFQHVNTYLLIRDVYREDKDIEMEIKMLNKAVDLILNYRQKAGKDKEQFTHKFMNVFNELIQLYKSTDQKEKALEVSEKMRGLSISESFQLKYALYHGKVPEDKIQEILQLKNDLELLDSKRAAALNAGDKNKSGLDSISKEIEEKESKLNAIDSELKSSKSIYKDLRNLEIPGIPELQRHLAKTNKVFVEYNLSVSETGKEALTAFIITPDDFKYLELGEDVDLTRKINNLRVIISTYPKESDRKFIALQNKDTLKEVIVTFGQVNGLLKKGKDVYREELDLKNYDGGTKKYVKKYLGTEDRKVEMKEANKIMNDLLQEIYKIAIAPVLAVTHTAESKNPALVISPDKILFTVPFHALKDADGKYLADKHSVTLVPSATVWDKLLDKKPAGYKHSFFGIGNAVYGSGHENVAVARGKRSAEDSDVIVKSSFRSFPKSMKNLPGSSEELRELSKLAYNKEEAGEHIFTGVRANKDELLKKFRDKKQNKDYKIIHFSVHGLFFSESPELNSLALTERENAVKYQKEDLEAYEKEKGSPITSDGFLKLGETIDLSLECELLVMSACETSLGTERAGEGLVGLPQAFLMGGANHVMATLWSVDDTGTMLFMKQFYSKLLDPKNKDKQTIELLRKTQTEFENKEHYSDPFYWAPFVVFGR